jgi:hypothetical protein
MHHAFEIDDGCRALTFRAGHQKTNKLRRVKFQAPHNAGTRIGLMNVFEVIEYGNPRSHVAAEALAEKPLVVLDIGPMFCDRSMFDVNRQGLA